MKTPDSDALIQGLLADPAQADLREWLGGATATDQRTLGELATTEESVRLADEIYRAGAVDVIAVKISEYRRQGLDDEVLVQNSGKLILRLPRDPDQRRKVFRWEAGAADRLGFDPTPDSGQERLLVMLD